MSPYKGKGKGKQHPKPQLWCEIHQAYGHSTDWCFDNPNRSGGPPKPEWPPKQEWCDHHQRYGHSTDACRKGKGKPSMPPPTEKGSKGAKGKTKSSNREWKSDNFPADYDQATPVLPTEQPPHVQWWNTDEEISSVCLEEPRFICPIQLTDITLAAFENEDLDEATASLLDLHFLAIIQQHDRHQAFQLNPSPNLQQEIVRHAQYIQFAYSLLDPTHQEIVARFLLIVVPPQHTTGQLAMIELESPTRTEIETLTTNQVAIIQATAVTNTDEFYSAHLTNTRIPMEQLSDQPNAYPVYEYNYRP
jgi:hypothetical protein